MPAFGHVKGELPRVGVELLAAYAWWMRIELAGSESHVNAFGTELCNGVLEGLAGGEPGGRC